MTCAVLSRHFLTLACAFLTPPPAPQHWKWKLRQQLRGMQSQRLEEQQRAVLLSQQAEVGPAGQLSEEQQVALQRRWEQQQHGAAGPARPPQVQLEVDGEE